MIEQLARVIRAGQTILVEGKWQQQDIWNRKSEWFLIKNEWIFDYLGSSLVHTVTVMAYPSSALYTVCMCFVLFCLCLMDSGKLGQWGAPGQYTSCSNTTVLPDSRLPSSTMYRSSVLLYFIYLFIFLLRTYNMHHILIIAQNPPAHINDSIIPTSSSLLSCCLLLALIDIGFLCRGLRDGFNSDLQIALAYSSHLLFTPTFREREMRPFSQSIWLDSTSVHAGRLEWLLKPKIGLLPWLLSDTSFTFPTAHQYVH